MNKNIFQKASMLFAGIIISLFLNSCYNKIEEELVDSEIPIHIKTNIIPIQTRMDNNQFEDKDVIGVFLTTSKNKQKDYYLSNIPFNYKSSTFTSKSVIYYPKTQESCCIYGYYPFDINVLDKESGLFHVKVESEQNNKAKLNLSDFLTATTKDVYADVKPLNLNFKHRNTKLRISLEPSEGYTADDLLKTMPKVTLHHMPTNALYDIEDDKFSEHTNFQPIKPLIEWKNEANKVTGAEVILLPDFIFTEDQYISLEAENIIYTCKIPKDLLLKSGTINSLLIHYNPTKGIEIGQTNPLISDWDEGINKETTANENSKAISISSLLFEKSNIYNLVNSKGVIRAEVCKEFLNSPNLTTQAIVLYPVKENKPQLDKGILLKRLGEDSCLDGGSINWNLSENTFTYTATDQVIQYYLFIAEDGSISFEEPQNAEFIHIEEALLKDNRKDEHQTYPIVKIGTQYWMQKELNTIYKNDGTPLAFQKDELTINAGFSTFSEAPGYKFYNVAALESEQIAPKGWKIPEVKDVSKLSEYINNKVDYLKGCSCCMKEQLYNCSYFSAPKTGVYKNSFITGSTTYWCYDKNDTNKYRIYVLQHLDNRKEPEIKEQDKTVLSTIRCLKN
ncbi:fimbrillin family protein [Bacteroides sp.]|uniref:fimbrillin family protein n=1 Tax=Bacteroides sp. TaxID=29523 RepID=UPI002586B7FA|nr:fimbrillin family protein [Bacteroides sp.]